MRDSAIKRMIKNKKAKVAVDHKSPQKRQVVAASGKLRVKVEKGKP
jgi:hypothetical protein